MAHLVVTREAEDDVNGILEYLRQGAGTRVSDNYGERFHRTIGRLLEFPLSGSRRPALGSQARIAVVNPYVIIYDYTPDSDMLTLLRVVHGRRDISLRLLAR